MPLQPRRPLPRILKHGISLINCRPFHPVSQRGFLDPTSLWGFRRTEADLAEGSMTQGEGNLPPSSVTLMTRNLCGRGDRKNAHNYMEKKGIKMILYDIASKNIDF